MNQAVFVAFSKLLPLDPVNLTSLHSQFTYQCFSLLSSNPLQLRSSGLTQGAQGPPPQHLCQQQQQQIKKKTAAESEAKLVVARRSSSPNNSSRRSGRTAAAAAIAQHVFVASMTLHASLSAAAAAGCAAAATRGAAAAAAASASERAPANPSEEEIPHGIILVVHFLRHAEGTHNLSAQKKPPGRSFEWVYGQQQHFDADLSPHGIAQARAAAALMPAELLLALQRQQQQQQQQVCCCCPVAVVYTSTLRRTIRTAYEVLRTALGAAAAPAAAAAEPLDVPVLCLDETREWGGGGHFCDGRHRLSEQGEWASRYFKNISFDPKIEEDPMPSLMPRESRSDIEGRCLLFLQRLSNLAAAAAAATAVGAAAAAKASAAATTAAVEPTCPRCNKTLLLSSSSSRRIDVLCVGHSAWMRCFFSLLSLFEPEARGLKNCGWKSVSFRGDTIEALLPQLQQKRLSPRCCPPGLLLGLNGEGISGLEEPPAAAGGAGAAPVGGQWRIASLSLLLKLRAWMPLTVLCYPPAADAAAAEPQALNDAVSKLRCWIESQQQQQQQQQHLTAGVVSFGFQRKRVLIDGLDCIRRLTNPQQGEAPLEVVLKERVHREPCLLLCLLPLIPNPQEGEEEISLLLQSLLPLQGGAEACLRLDVLSLR
ncbi:hypothetical protein Esti_000022 [Eimeria stiedai]